MSTRRERRAISGDPEVTFVKNPAPAVDESFDDVLSVGTHHKGGEDDTAMLTTDAEGC